MCIGILFFYFFFFAIFGSTMSVTHENHDYRYSQQFKLLNVLLLYTVAVVIFLFVSIVFMLVFFIFFASFSLFRLLGKVKMRLQKKLTGFNFSCFFVYFFVVVERFISISFVFVCWKFYLVAWSFRLPYVFWTKIHIHCYAYLWKSKKWNDITVLWS